MSDRFNFDKVLRNLNRVKNDLPQLLSKDTLRYFVDSFNREEWDGKKWKEVQRRTPGTSAYKYPAKKGLQRRTAHILVGSGYGKRGGTLRRALATSTQTATFQKISFHVRDVNYAKYHNDGEGRMPMRRFMGQTRALTAMQTSRITRTINKIWQA